VLAADGVLIALAWVALFAAVTAIITASSELVPMQDGADEAVPAPRPPHGGAGARPHLAASARGTLLVVLMAGFAAGHGFGGNFPARLGGVLLGAGACTLAAALWLARWERRTGQILLVGPARPAPQTTPAPTPPASAPARTDVADVQRKLMAGKPLAPDDHATLARIPEKESKARETPHEAYYVLPRDPADWPTEWPGDASPVEPAPAEPQPPGGGGWRPGIRTTVWLAVGAAFFAGLVVLGSFAPDEPAPLAFSRCTGVAPLPRATLDAGVRLPAGIAVEIAAAGALWGLATEPGPRPDADGRTAIVRLDPASGRELARSPLSFSPTMLVPHGGAIWAAASGERRVVRLDGRTGRESGAIALDLTIISLVSADDGLWAMDLLGSLQRVDPETGRVDAVIRTGNAGTALASAGGGLWLLEEDGEGLLRVDARTGAVRMIPLDVPYPQPPVVGFGSVWVAGHGVMARVDARSLEVRAPGIPVGPGFVSPFVGPDAIWLTGAEKGAFRVDHRCDQPVGPYFELPGRRDATLMTGLGRLWIRTWTDDLVTPIRLGD
jgi:hypothetical protein